LKILSLAAALILAVAVKSPAEPATLLGDIVLYGTVERDGRRLPNDSIVFEGDTIRTSLSSGGVLRLGRARLEVGEETVVAIDRADPLQIRLESGSLAFSFPEGKPFEILTPQMELRADDTAGSSGIVNAGPAQDRIHGIAGVLYAREIQPLGARRRIRAGEYLVATLADPADLPIAALLLPPQASQQVAALEAVEGDVYRTPVGTSLSNRVITAGIGLFDGDTVTTRDGRADIRFAADQSLVTLDVGTVLLIEERDDPAAGGLFRRLTQTAGSIWFSITSFAEGGTRTELETPTAVAAIRGTDGAQLVPNETESTHAIDEGIEDVTERITGEMVTLTDGQIVTAIRGVGFTPVAALIAAIPRPAVGTGGGPGAAGGAAGTAAGATTASVSTVAAVTATTGATAAVATVAALTANQTDDVGDADAPTGEPDDDTPLNPPGGDVAVQTRTARLASPSTPVPGN
jgi:hypothetical protein